MASPEDSRPRVPSKLECSLMAEKRKSCVTRCSQPGGTARSGQPKPTGIRSAGSHVADLTLVTGPGTGVDQKCCLTPPSAGGGADHGHVKVA